MAYTACFIGLGMMGTPMASNLLKNHVELGVYNRSKDKMEPLITQGAKAINVPSEAFDHSPIVFSMVANDQALLEITTGENGILKNVKKGCIHVSMSTISPQLSQALSAKHEEKGVSYVAAPVFGRPEAAAQQKLWICMAGNPEAKKQIEPLLHFLGQKVYDFGNAPESANAVKLTGNFLILSMVEVLAEAFAFAQKNGIDVKKFHDFLLDSL